jgi:regulatory protein
MMNIREYVSLLYRYRLRTRKELIYRLKSKGFKKEDIDIIIEELEKEGLIDDERFARLFVDIELEKGVYGKEVLIKKLLGKGVEYEVARKVLDELWNEDRIVEKGREVFKKLKKKEKNLNKIINYFLRRNISYEIIKKITGLTPEKLKGGN